MALRRLTNSGGELPPSVVRRMRELFPAADIYSMYGLTEAFRSTYLDPGSARRPSGLDGQRHSRSPRSWSSTPTATIAAGEEGELVHAGPLVAQGLLATIRSAPPSASGRRRPARAYGGMAVWSGDRVRRDADGLLYFVGREDAMIKTAGNRVSPTEVEEAAMASGLVAEAVALGFPDARLGEAIALVVRAGPARPGRGAARLPQARACPISCSPGLILWRDELPRSPNGKLDRVALKSELTA